MSLKFLPVQIFVGLLLCNWIPYLFLDWGYLDQGPNKTSTFNIIASGMLTLLTLFTLNLIRQFPGINSTSYILPVFIFWFIVVFALAEVTYFPFYLIYYSISSMCLLSYIFIVNIINRYYTVQTLAYIPIGRSIDMPAQVTSAEWLKLDTTTLDQNVNGIVVDLHSNDLTNDWQEFIAHKTLQGIPVYHHRHIRESLTGRVKINHMYENDLGSLLPSANYMVVKRFLELILIFASLPITLIIIIVTAILIKLESPGPVFFVQQRVGLAGKEFTIYKFRSMTKDSEEHGAKMASQGDMRVTRIGKFIRKVRIDELPQFWNIVRGDMSLIGPRPEQKVFVDQFENTIPFYNYRHIVKPGITGWAQVTHGYAANEDETKIKVEHDFYYIKNFSFSLDVLIFFKTIFTMLTGFGAR